MENSILRTEAFKSGFQEIKKVLHLKADVATFFRIKIFGTTFRFCNRSGTREWFLCSYNAFYPDYLSLYVIVFLLHLRETQQYGTQFETRKQPQ